MGAIQNSLNSVVGSLAGAAYAGKKLAAEQGQATELKKINEDTAKRAEQEAEQEEKENRANISESIRLQRQQFEKDWYKQHGKEVAEYADKRTFGSPESRAKLAFNYAKDRINEEFVLNPARQIQLRYANGEFKNFAEYKAAMTQAYQDEADMSLDEYGLKPLEEY